MQPPPPSPHSPPPILLNPTQLPNQLLQLKRTSSNQSAISDNNSGILSTTKQFGHIHQQQPVSQQSHHKYKKYKKKQKPLTQEQIQVFRQAFEIFDSNHSGSIDQTELKSLMSALGYNYDDEQIMRILQEVDQDGSGVIEIDEFVEFMSKHMLDTQNLKKQMRKVFAHFDDDNSGFLDHRKIRQMASECFFNLDEQSINNMIKAADTDGGMKISQYEFFRIMKKVKLI